MHKHVEMRRDAGGSQNPKSEIRNPTRCDGATARREEVRNRKSKTAEAGAGDRKRRGREVPRKADEKRRDAKSAEEGIQQLVNWPALGFRPRHLRFSSFRRRTGGALARLVGFRISDLFRISDFGFRISDFEARRAPKPALTPMLQALVHFSLEYRRVVVALACVLLGYGVYVVSHAKLDVFPNFVQPQVVIQAECPGLAPEQVELLVTLPIETVVNGLGNMESLRSESIEGLSIITAVFKEAPTCSAPGRCWPNNWRRWRANCRPA
jgi:hypothetical protein